MVAASSRVLHIPDAIDDAQALAALGSGLTALSVTDAGEVSAGDYVLVTAAAGSIGTMVSQLVQLKGGRVIGLASSQRKRDLVTSLGAAAALDSTGDWESQIDAVTDGHGLDVVLDSTGGPTLDAGLRSLAPGGRHILYGFAIGTPGTVTPDLLGRLMTHRISLIGLTLDATDDQLMAERTAQLMTLMADGSVRLPDHLEYPLADAARAHRDLADRKTAGKVLLRT